MVDSNQDSRLIQPTIHTFSSRQVQATTGRMESTSSCFSSDKLSLKGSSKPHLIVVPHGDQSGHQHELIQEVFRYPPGSIETVVEKSLPLIFAGPEKSQNNARKIRRNQKKFHASQSSIGSSSSAVSSKSLSSLPSQTDSVQSIDSISNMTELKTNYLPDARPFIHKFHERCENDLMSDTSSNISTVSDLSGYEDEYTTIKRLISDGSYRGFGKRTLGLNETLRKKSYIETRIQDQENTIKSLHTYKEDLEIQVHRLSIQLQNAVREKEVCQEQLDAMQTKLTEKNEQQYFEILKEKVSLEGQYETLKQEFQHSSATISHLETKLHQSEVQTGNLNNEKLKLLNSEKEIKSSVNHLEKQNLKLENELKAANEILNQERENIHTLKNTLDDKAISLTEALTQLSAYTRESENYQETIQNLKKWNLEYSEREEQQRDEKRKLENLLSESMGKFNALKENSEWFQAQLSKTQTLQSELQNELAETKSSLSVVSADRDRCKRESDRLNAEIEDSRAKAVRDKSLLLVQLEELEADMREREAVIRRLEEGDKVSHVKLSEDRFKRLEEDHKRLQELKIESRDMLRRSDSLKEEIRHKNSLLRRHEETIHDLRKELAVSQKELDSKQIRIDSLLDRWAETKSKLEKSQKKVHEGDIVTKQLKEHKLKLEASILSAEDDKKQVNETIVKLKEDMSKLSSNFFRMKHDLSAKDKQIESLTSQNSELSHSKKDLTSKTEALSAKLKEHEEAQTHVTEIANLKEALKKSNTEATKSSEEIYRFKKSLEAFEVEKKSWRNSLTLRDEQIENMRGVIEAYKEKILQKDEEIFTKKDHTSKLEKSHSELQKKFNFLNNEYQMNLQEKEEFRKLELSYDKSLLELKESVKFEKKAKENYEKSYKEVFAQLTIAQESMREMEGNLNRVKGEAEEEREKGLKYQSEIGKIKSEFETRNNDILDFQNRIKDLSSKLEENLKARTASETGFGHSLKSKDGEIMKLNETLSSKISEIQSLHLIIAEKNESLEATKINSNRYANPDKTSSRLNAKRTAKNCTKISKDEKREIELLKHKLKDSSNQVSKKTKEINALMSDLENTKTREQHLNFKLEELRNQIDQLTNDNNLLNERMTSLQQGLQQSQRDFMSKEEECDQWKIKYENLVDTIPQRDTNTRQESRSEVHNFKDSFVGPLCLEKSTVQHVDLEEKVMFTQTMAYLQNQISLTAQALQSKDRQIIELNKKLNTDKKIDPISVIEGKPLSCDASTSISELESPTQYISPNDTTHKNISPNDASAELTESNATLSRKEIEMKEKLRRYESNLRLLTRKLKEHMKGRRVTEKELEMAIQEGKNNIEAEANRYQALKNRCIDLEQNQDRLASALSSCEMAKRDRETSLLNAERDLERERREVLQMQKEIGQMEELKKCLFDSRSKMNVLGSELLTKSKAVEEANQGLKVVLEEKRGLEAKVLAVEAQREEMAQIMAREQSKVLDRERELEAQREDLSKKDEDISTLTQDLGAMGLKCNLLEESIQRLQNQEVDNCKKISLLKEEVDRLNSCVELKNSLIQDLNAKKDILENGIKIKEESIECLKGESSSLSHRLSEAEHKSCSLKSSLDRKKVESKEIESALNDRLSAVHKEKIAYQSHCTQLKVALNSLLEKFQSSSPLLSLPSPSPLNTESLTKLMEQCSNPPSGANRFAVSLSQRLDSLREEVSVLQSEIKARDH